MIKLIRNADVYAPAHLGKRDILICDSKISAIEPSLEEYAQLRGVEVFDAAGMRTIPGYIDQHMHITGGGGEQGFSSRVPEARLSEIVSAGVTTVLGMLGTDSVTRTLENLLAKARMLEEEGITAFMLTGSYSYPSVTLTGSVTRDLVLIDKVLGVKIALSDHRSSNLTADEFIRLCSEARLGGMVSGKAGLTVIHMGSGQNGFKLIYTLMEKSDVPVNNILPTHVGRCEEVFEDAIHFAKAGGNIDITAGQSGRPGDTAAQIAHALEHGVDPERITISSDAFGSQPIFNDAKQCIGITYTMPNVLHDEIKLMINKFHIPLEQAISFLTTNVARILGLQDRKGTLCVNADADIVMWDENMDIRYVFAKGQVAVCDGNVIMKGRFES